MMNLKVAFLDVYHGDCSVITFEEAGRKACIVVDGGETVNAAKRLAAYFLHEGVEIIDLMVATHIDSDHVRGLIHLLEKNSRGSNSWNKGSSKCIRHYWGPKPDPDYQPVSRSTSVTSSSNGGANLKTRDFVIQSVDENQRLNGLVKKHVLTHDGIHYPSLENLPPLDIFDGVVLTLLAPDIQVNDTDIKKRALLASNRPYQLRMHAQGAKRRQKALSLADLKQIVAMNAEEMAAIADRTANNQSIVFKLSPRTANNEAASEWTFLFTGDAEHESWSMMRGHANAGENLHARVLKVPHHGSRNGIDRESFVAVRPKFSIISTGSRHGLPDGDILNLIRTNGDGNIFCTERNMSTSEPGPCLGKTDCVRKTTSHFRSLAFEINTRTGQANIYGFTIDTRPESYTVKPGNEWCPERSWSIS